MPLKPDPIAHIRESLTSWIHSAPEGVIRSLLKIRGSLDANYRKPLPPAGWRPIQLVAQERNLDRGHLARICRHQLAPLDQAKLCTHRGRQTWHLSPNAEIPDHRATNAPSDTSPVPGSAALDSRQASDRAAPRSTQLEGAPK